MQLADSADHVRGDRRAVSPVIGIVLMVSITVILAAVIGTFVIGVGDQVSPQSPTASFEYEFNDGGNGWNSADNWVNITHTGGNEIEQDHIAVRIGDEPVNGAGANWSDPITAGDMVEITDTPGTTDYATVADIDEGDIVQIIWSRSDVEKSIILSEREVP